jgi:hypothetical protein
MTHFISQSAPDIRNKLKQLENGLQTPQAEILNVAFKVYNYQEEQQSGDKERRDKAKFQMLAQALRQNRTPSLWLPTHKARENLECLPAHVFSVALRDTEPMSILRYSTHQDHILSANRRATG